MRGSSTASVTAPLLIGLLTLTLSGCQSGAEELTLPASTDLDGLYGDRASATLNGNVVDVRARQAGRQLERGGDLWAKVGPYIYLFSPQTQELFQNYSGVAAVRVRTVTEGGEWVAEATLPRDTLNAITWKQARNRVAKARTQGTDKPGYLEDLVDYGEERTSYRYNARFVDES